MDALKTEHLVLFSGLGSQPHGWTGFYSQLNHIVHLHKNSCLSENLPYAKWRCTEQ